MSEKYKYLLVGLVIGGILVIMGSYMHKPAKEEEIAAEIPTRLNNNRISGYQLPKNLDFAGEKVPLHRPEIRERLEREVLVNAFWHSNSVITIKRANKWLPIIDSILRANEVPVDFKYLAVAESGLDNVISPANAVGFWQFLSGTARDFGLVVNDEIDQRYDPVLATVAATKYLKKAYERFGNWTTVAASYNLGMNATQKILTKQKPESYYDMLLSEEPARYVFRILAIKNLLENQEVFGFEIPIEQLYRQPKTKSIVLDQSVPDLHDYAKHNGISYSQLRMLNPWIRSYQIKIPAGKSFVVKIPQN